MFIKKREYYEMKKEIKDLVNKNEVYRLENEKKHYSSSNVKVYCSDCKWFCDAIVGDLCKNPVVGYPNPLYRTIADEERKSTSLRIGNIVDEINKNNDCKFFEYL